MLCRSKSSTLLCSFFLTTTLYSPAQAGDTRALGMGSADVSAGHGAAGALANPSLMMKGARLGDEYSFNINMQGNYRDPGDLIGEIDRNKNVLDELEAEIDVLKAQPITCTSGEVTEVCLTGTQPLAEIATRVINSFYAVDEQSFSARGGFDFGVVKSGGSIPFLINIGTSATASGQVDITESDFDYVSTLEQVLEDDQLTLAEIQDSAPITLEPTDSNVDVDLPDDVLESAGQGTAAARTQLSIGLAQSIDFGAHSIDLGVTPKISYMTVGDIRATVKEINDDYDVETEIKDSKNTATTFTLDVGASMEITDTVTLGGSIRNLIPESVNTNNGVKVETTPQLIVSALFERNLFRVTADLALNEAKLDNYETQTLRVGGEFGNRLFKVRAGINHELAIDENPTDVTVGVGIGFVNLSVGINDGVSSAGIQVGSFF